MIKINIENKIIRNMLISGSCKPISLVISYLYIPLVLDYLGIEKYGIWTTILTILSWISYFDIGIGNGLRNKLTVALTKKNNKPQVLISSAYAFISMMMLFVVIVSFFLVEKINWNFVFNVNEQIQGLNEIVFLSILFMCLNFVLSLCKNVLYALQKAPIVSYMEIISQLINLLLLLLVRNFYRGNLFIIAVIYGGSILFTNIVFSMGLYIKNGEIIPRLSCIDFNEGKNLTKIGVHFFIIQICAIILFTTDSFIISILYGATYVTPYSTVNKLYSILISIFAAFLAPIWSGITEAKAKKSFCLIENLIKKINLLMFPFFIGAIVLMVFFRSVSKIWLGVELDYSSGLIILGGIYCILYIWTNTYGTIANGMEILREQVMVAIIQVLVNIPLSVFFAEVVGMKSAGILMGTNITLTISCIFLPLCIRNRIRREQ